MLETILVYSGSGFLGLNIIANLQSEEMTEIYVVSKRGLDNTICSKLGINVSKIRVYKEIESLPQIKFNRIYHLGASSQPEIFVKQISENIEKNVISSKNLQSILSDTGTLIYFSSSEIYSGCEDLPCSENHMGNFNVDLGRRTYILSKLLTEDYLSSIINPLQKLVILRVSLVYGPGTHYDDKRVLYKFIRESKSGTIKIQGDSAATRRYLYIADFINALNQIVKLELSGIFNIGGSTKISIEELAHLIGELTNSKVYSESGYELKVGVSPTNVHVTNSKLTNLIGKFESTTLSTGLTNTLNWFEKLTQ